MQTKTANGEGRNPRHPGTGTEKMPQKNALNDKGNGAIPFTKMCGHGNDFIVMSDVKGALKRGWRQEARLWCRRRTGIGADGLLVLEAGGRGDFRLRIFNADGSEAEMCGNGARCAAAYAVENGLAGQNMTFETLAGMIEGEVSGRDVTIRLTDVTESRKGLSVDLGKEAVLQAHFVNSGVPHAVLFMDTLQQIPEFRVPLKDVAGEFVRKIGRMVRFHPVFGAAGTNVDFVEAAGPGHIVVRTYERGVEDETLACGTGAVASAIAASESVNGGSPPVRVDMAGGTLRVNFDRRGSRFESVRLAGPVQKVYYGFITV